MAGPLKTLLGALQASTFLSGVTVVYGDEETNTQRWDLPCIVMVAKGGPYVEPGYAGNTDPAVETLWETAERVDFWLWGASTDPANQGAIDHTDAIETLRQLLLSALRDQRAQYTDVNNVAYGLAYRVVDGRWETLANAVSKYGRAYVLTVQIQISIPMAAPQEATVTNYQLNQSFVDKPAT